MKSKIKKIPYGVTDFELFKTENYYYVDKTKYIELIEESPNYLFLIRPRRFGKSLFLSILTSYYDVHYKDKFDFFFSDTYIGKNKTESRGKYLILSFNFAMVDPRIENTEESFEFHFKEQVALFLSKYESFFTEKQLQEIGEGEKSIFKFVSILRFGHQNGLDIFIIIDEYDNFTNSILASYGEAEYLKFTKEKGFFKHFFNVIKGGTTGTKSAISKMYITGVSPITLEDVTSGGIGNNITTHPLYNEFVGFTESEVIEMLEYYKKHGKIKHEISELLAIFRLWFGNYKFTRNAKNTMYNSTMVFHFMVYYLMVGEFPLDLLDDNTKIDYGKLQHLLIIDQKLNGNFSILRNITEKRSILAQIESSFSIKYLTNRDNLVSLLFYFGLLTIKDYKEGNYELTMPNESVKLFFASYIKDAYRDTNIFKLDIYEFMNLYREMTYRGDWKQVFNFLSEEIKKQTKIRDYISGESMIKGFLLAYLNLFNYYTVISEKELNKGFADIWLNPMLFQYPDIPYSYLIEIKYFKRQNKGIPKDKMKAKIKEAKTQLDKYAKDELITKTKTKVIKLILIYNAWELVHIKEV